MRRLLRYFTVITLIVAALLGSFYLTTYKNSGERARPLVSAAEQPFLVMYDRVQVGMSYNEVVGIMGIPYRDGQRRRTSWQIEESPFNQIVGYFENDKLIKFRWLKIPGFILEK